jgi:hypothetical protein
MFTLPRLPKNRHKKARRSYLLPGRGVCFNFNATSIELQFQLQLQLLLQLHCNIKRGSYASFPLTSLLLLPLLPRIQSYQLQE